MGDFAKLCMLSELNEGQGREFLVEGRVVAIFRVGDSALAVDGICAHQGGPIAKGTVDGHCVTCPWHGWQYDIRSGVNLLTQKPMLECFAVELRGDEVWIRIDD
ncbi:MAG: Rieske (2Fe-2S) protein [Pirellulaceae bacterium]|nr:Rieske (2Fe-2S) protein [Pirellulaceae bacterium]